MEEIVKLRNLSKKFGDFQVLKDVSFTVEKGSVFGFLGKNGSGKTTTMRLILDLLKADKGSIEVYGTNFGLSKEIRKKTGVLLEKNGMHEALSAYQNLEYYCHLYDIQNTKQRINEVLEIVDLKGKENVLVGKFSTGMNKKLGLARALLHDPEILFLDEPTTGLDPEAQLDFRELISNLSKKKSLTVFLNTHNLAEAEKICSHIAILKDGTVKKTGKLSDLKKEFSSSTLEELYFKIIGGHNHEI